MSRRRYISTEMSKDGKLITLAEYGPLPLLLYTWAIPHMDDWGRITGDAREFKMQVCPALDNPAKEIDEALNQIASVGLWQRYEVDGRRYIAVPSRTWFKYQTYIAKEKRTDDSGSQIPPPPDSEYAENHRKTPQNARDLLTSPQNTSSPSPSPSPSLSPSNTEGGATAGSDREPTDEEMNNLIFGVFGACGKSEYDELGRDIAKTSKAVVALALRETAKNATRSRPKYYRQIMVSWGKAKTLADVAAIQADHGKAGKNAQAGPHTKSAGDDTASQRNQVAMDKLLKRLESREDGVANIA